MTENPNARDAENFADTAPDREQAESTVEDMQDLDLDPDQAEDAQEDLGDWEAVDDVPWSPPEQRPTSADFAELDAGIQETIDDRIRQEEPEAGTAYGAPEAGGEALDQPGGESLGGDDPDAIPAERDVSGGDEADGPVDRA